jgi:hypothetical protein
MTLVHWAVLGGGMALGTLAWWYCLGDLWFAGRRAVIITPGDVVGLRLRGTKPRPIIDALAVAAHAGVPVTISQLEVHSLAGGNVGAVVEAAVRAKAKGLACPWAGLRQRTWLGLTQSQRLTRESIPAASWAALSSADGFGGAASP